MNLAQTCISHGSPLTTKYDALFCSKCGSVVDSWRLVDIDTGAEVAVINDDDDVEWCSDVFDGGTERIAGRNDDGFTDRVLALEAAQREDKRAEARETGRIGGMLRHLMTPPERRKEIARLGGKAKAERRAQSRH